MISVGPRERPQDPSCEGTSPSLAIAVQIGDFRQQPDERLTRGEPVATADGRGLLNVVATPTGLRAAAAALKETE